MIFIELTDGNTGKKFLANVQLAQRFLDSEETISNSRSFEKANGKSYISGLTNNGGFYIRETYQEVKQKLIEAGVTII
jgi:hypothetical protein